MPRKKLKILFAAAACIALLCACTSSEEKAFALLREQAESKSGVVYRTTYFVSQPTKEEGFPYPLSSGEKYCFAYIDENGSEQILTEAVFTDARDSYQVDESIYIAPAIIDDKWGYVLLDTASPDTESVSWAIEPKYDNAEIFTEQAAAVSMDGLYGIINENGEFLLAPYYDEIKYRSFTYMPASKDGEWYFIDVDGSRIFGPFEDAESFEYGYAGVKKDGKWGYIDKNGADATAFVYDDAYSVEGDGCAWVCTDGKWEKVNVRNAAD